MKHKDINEYFLVSIFNPRYDIDLNMHRHKELRRFLTMWNLPFEDVVFQEGNAPAILTLMVNEEAYRKAIKCMKLIEFRQKHHLRKEKA